MNHFTFPLTVLAACALSPAYAKQSFAWQPDAIFVQAGTGRHVDAATAGFVWNWDWRHDWGIGTITGYTEVDVSRWRTSGREHDEGFNQFGVTPVLRFYPSPWGSGWFVEAGIGANVISPKYRNDTRVFSTKFNFGDHLAIGRQFGGRQEHEFAVRFQHFSNAGIDKPNPGENFVQVRYVFRF